MIPERATICPVPHLKCTGMGICKGTDVPDQQSRYNNMPLSLWLKQADIPPILHHTSRPSVKEHNAPVPVRTNEDGISIDCRDDIGVRTEDLSHGRSAKDSTSLDFRDNTEVSTVAEVIGECKPASLSLFADKFSRLCIYHEDHEVYLCTGTADYYLVDDLKHLLHSFENGTPMPESTVSTRRMVIVPPVVDAITNKFVIVRAGGSSGYFEKHFGDLDINFSKILSFVRTHGSINPSRDGMSGNEVPSRIDFGCAGDGWEKASDGTALRPYLTCGMDIFDKLDPELKEEIKFYYATIMDRMQLIHDDIEMSELHNDRPYNFSPRTLEYGTALREAVGASFCRMEWMTTQAKKVSVNERTEEHKDERNCTWKGYTKTAGFCVMLQCQSSKELFSLKFIANSRARIGQYYGDHLAMNPILTRIRSHVEKIDQNFALMHQQQVANRFNDASVDRSEADMSMQTPTHLTFFDLVLDNWSPWIPTKIGKNKISEQDVISDVMSMPANITRSFFLSPACTIIYRLKQHLQMMHNAEAAEEKLIETAVICAYQTSMIRPFHVAHRRIGELDCNHPGVRLYNMLIDEFGSLTGSSGCRRLNPTGVNFHAAFMQKKRIVVDDVVYEDKHNEMNGVMSVVVTHIQKLMDSLNEMLQSDSFHHDEVEEAFKQTCDVWKSMDVDIGEFRLMLIVQVSFIFASNLPVCTVTTMS